MKDEYGQVCYTKQANGKYGFDREDYPFYGKVSMANGTAFTVAAFIEPKSGRLFVGIENLGCYTFSQKSMPSYVNEKLNIKSEVDAQGMADFICGQFGVHEQYQENLDEEFL